MHRIKVARVKIQHSPRSFASAIESGQLPIIRSATRDDIDDIKVIRMKNPHARPDTRVFKEETPL